jgi:hypothetical protein
MMHTYRTASVGTLLKNVGHWQQILIWAPIGSGQWQRATQRLRQLQAEIDRRVQGPGVHGASVGHHG